MNEIWKDIIGYEGLYLVSNHGRILSYARTKKRIMKPSINTKGYPQVNLWKNETKSIYRVHRLVLETFKGISDLQVNHKDGVKTNNSLENLEYCTNEENKNHAVKNGLVAKGFNLPITKLSIDQVVSIKQRLRNNETAWKIAKDFPVLPGTIYAIKNGLTFKYVSL